MCALIPATKSKLLVCIECLQSLLLHFLYQGVGNHPNQWFKTSVQYHKLKSSGAAFAVVGGAGAASAAGMGIGKMGGGSGASFVGEAAAMERGGGGGPMEASEEDEAMLAAMMAMEDA